LRLTRYLEPDRVLLINLISEAVAACLADLRIRLIWRCGLRLPEPDPRWNVVRHDAIGRGVDNEPASVRILAKEHV
jgi:hypothetical protein